jgi:hypothetical protein
MSSRHWRRSNHAVFFQYRLIDFLRLFSQISAGRCRDRELSGPGSGISQLYLKRMARVLS